VQANDFIDAMIKLQRDADESGVQIVEIQTTRKQAHEVLNVFNQFGGLYRTRLSSNLQLPTEGGVIGELVGIRLRVPAEALVLTVQPTQLSINTAQQQLADYAKKVRT